MRDDDDDGPESREEGEGMKYVVSEKVVFFFFSFDQDFSNFLRPHQTSNFLFQEQSKCSIFLLLLESAYQSYIIFVFSLKF